MPGYVYRGTDLYTPPTIEKRAKSGPKPRTELPPFDPTLCGDMSGYRQHKVHGQPHCRACLDAHNVYKRAYRAERRRR